MANPIVTFTMEDGGIIKAELYPEIAPNKRKLVTHPVKIGNKVWIGENVVILAGAEIGDGCIIGANSVVKGKIEKNQIVVGAPAMPIKRWDNKKNEWIKINSGENNG